MMLRLIAKGHSFLVSLELFLTWLVQRVEYQGVHGRDIEAASPSSFPTSITHCIQPSLCRHPLLNQRLVVHNYHYLEPRSHTIPISYSIITSNQHHTTMKSSVHYQTIIMLLRYLFYYVIDIPSYRATGSSRKVRD